MCKFVEQIRNHVLDQEQESPNSAKACWTSIVPWHSNSAILGQTKPRKPFAFRAQFPVAIKLLPCIDVKFESRCYKWL